jgi:hypothetical protein
MARPSVAALVIDHVEQLAMVLMQTDRLPDSKAQPGPDFKGMRVPAENWMKSYVSGA